MSLHLRSHSQLAWLHEFQSAKYLGKEAVEANLTIYVKVKPQCVYIDPIFPFIANIYYRQSTYKD